MRPSDSILRMPPKILIASFTFPPNKDGVAEAANSMAIDLASQGYEIVVCTGHLEERENLCPHPGVRVEQFSLDNWRPHSGPQDEALRMQNLIVAEAPNVIICQCWDIWATAIAERTFSSLPLTRKILVSHGYSTIWKPSARFPWGLKGLARGLIRLCSLPKTISQYDRVVFTSGKRDFDRFLDHTIAKYIRFPGIRIIPNSIDTSDQTLDGEEFRRRQGIARELVVMCVSNYFPGKNQELALRAFRRAAIPDSVLIFIGSSFNDYSKHLMELDARLCQSSPLGRVIFLEKLSRPETFVAYRAADIFLFTSKSETGPLVVLEALAAGVPFVSTRVGIVDQIPGGIVVNGEHRIAKALALLAADPVKRRRMLTVGRDEILKRFSRDKVCESRLQMIRELLDESSSSSPT